MPLQEIDARTSPPPIVAQVAGLMYRGVVNLLASLAGVGKTLVAVHLALQAARPEGGPFLGRHVLPTTVLVVNFDSPGEGRTILYWLHRLREEAPDADLGKVVVLEPDIEDYALTDAGIAQIRETAHARGARFIIIDSFMAAFPGTNLVRSDDVYQAMYRLRRLALELDAALLVIDHLPKGMAGERIGARGVIGSVAKPAQARSVHILTRVPPREVQGRHVLRWEVNKLSYGAVPEPFGLELVFERDRALLREADLPSEYAETRTDRAGRAMQALLVAQVGLVVSRRELLDRAITEANVSERTAENALHDLVNSLGEELLQVKMPGRGAPVGFRLVKTADGAGNNA